MSGSNLPERRRTSDTIIAVLEQRVIELERRCGIKESKISDLEAKIAGLEAFQNRAIGYAMAASAIATVASTFFNHLDK